jgi:hypothetical protein
MLTVAGLALAASMVVGQNSDVNVPPEAQSEFEYLVGDWTTSGESVDGAVTGEFSAKWSPGKHVLVIHSTWTDSKHTAKGTGIDGWDVGDRTITTLEFWSDGWSHFRKYTIKAPGVWRADECRGVTSEGKPVSGTAFVERKSQNEFIWRSENMKIAGEAVKDTKVVFTRKTK